jgi:hypothetical protein
MPNLVNLHHILKMKNKNHQTRNHFKQLCTFTDISVSNSSSISWAGYIEEPSFFPRPQRAPVNRVLFISARNSTLGAKIKDKIDDNPVIAGSNVVCRTLTRLPSEPDET